MLRPLSPSLLRLMLLGLTFATTLTSLGCGGSLEQTEDYKLGVPYEAQAEHNFCVPASILMWRLYDELGPISQYQIANQLGGPPCSPQSAAYGVGYYTVSGSNAYLDVIWSPSSSDRDELIARQITSADIGIPIMPIVGSNRNHVGIINGGKYDDEGSYWEWEFLYFHDPDPFEGPNIRYSGGTWLVEFCGPGYSYCGQIISSSAPYGWQDNLSTYGDSVAVYGGGGGCKPSECGPPPV